MYKKDLWFFTSIRVQYNLTKSNHKQKFVLCFFMKTKQLFTKVKESCIMNRYSYIAAMSYITSSCLYMIHTLFELHCLRSFPNKVLFREKKCYHQQPSTTLPCAESSTHPPPPPPPTQGENQLLNRFQDARQTMLPTHKWPVLSVIQVN